MNGFIRKCGQLMVSSQYNFIWENIMMIRVISQSHCKKKQHYGGKKFYISVNQWRDFEVPHSLADSKIKIPKCSFFCLSSTIKSYTHAIPKDQAQPSLNA